MKGKERIFKKKVYPPDSEVWDEGRRFVCKDGVCQENGPVDINLYGP
ncbi:MAG TPA: hypothetical protein VEF34_08850 [Syntrophobacteraceae bacterium]|nr:hypothetical protein [Syntrophobacteraceae bacterium]